MSTYTWIEAKLNFDTPELLEKAILLLRTSGHILPDNTMMSDETKIAVNDGRKVISEDGLTLSIPPEEYMNITNLTRDLITYSKSGFFHEGDADEEYFLVLNNGRKIDVSSAEAAIKFIENPSKMELDSLLLSEDEFDNKYKALVDDAVVDFFELRSDTFYEAFENAIECFKSEDVASKFFKDKIFVKALHSETRA